MLKSLKSKKIKIYLLNARLSRKSFKKWKKFKKVGIEIFNYFDYIFPQNRETLNYLKFFKVKKLRILGNLKFCENQKLKKNKSLSKIFNKHKILCAASTHYNEEELISNVHLNLKKRFNNLLTIIIPRHVERTNEIIEDLKNKNLKYVCHSDKKKLKTNTDIYLFDTYGESKSFYKISTVVFLGG